jgi:hypothetical protein
MTLANMRANGVRSLSVSCELCHRKAVMNVDAFDDAVRVPAFGPAGLTRATLITGPALTRFMWRLDGDGRWLE